MTMKEKIKIIADSMLISLFVAWIWPLFDLLWSVGKQLVQTHHVAWLPTLEEYLVGYLVAFVISSISFAYNLLKEER